MAALKFYVSLRLLVLCICRPTEYELPHSRDFYAGYIKALNDNFDVLFKPERLTRSISSAEEKESDEDPQKRDNTQDMDMHARKLRYGDIMNGQSLRESMVRATMEAQVSGPSATKKDQILNIQRKADITGINSADINTKNCTTRKEILPNEDEKSEGISGNKNIFDKQDDNLVSENVLDDNASGSGNNSEEGTSRGTEPAHDELTSRDSEISPDESDEDANISRISAVKTFATKVKDESDFEEKRETRNIVDDNRLDIITSEDKNTLDANRKVVRSTMRGSEEDEDASGDKNTNQGIIKAQEGNGKKMSFVNIEKIPPTDMIEGISDNESGKENEDHKLSAKKAILTEGDMGKGDSKKKKDFDVQKKTVLYAADDPTNQINKKVPEGDDDDQRKKVSYHVVIASKKTIVPLANVSIVKHTTGAQAENKKRKSKVKHHRHYTPEPEDTESSNKRVTDEEDDVVLPEAFTTEGDDDEDKALINAPEPTYISQIPGLESSTIERFTDENQEAARERGLSDRLNYQSPLMYYSRSPYGRNDFDNFRRHFILEHASMQHLPYMPGIMSGYTENQGERNIMSSFRHLMASENNLMLHGNENSNMLQPDGSVINEQYSSGLPPDNQEVVSFRTTPYYNQYRQQNGFSPPMEQIQYVDRYQHGLAESNTQGYIPVSTTEVPASVRSVVMDKRQRNDEDNVIKIPSAVIDRFIQNAAQIYEFGNELVHHSPALMENSQIGMPRSSVASRHKDHEQVIIQPILVLMPYSS